MQTRSSPSQHVVQPVQNATINTTCDPYTHHDLSILYTYITLNPVTKKCARITCARIATSTRSIRQHKPRLMTTAMTNHYMMITHSNMSEHVTTSLHRQGQATSNERPRSTAFATIDTRPPTVTNAV